MLGNPIARYVARLHWTQVLHFLDSGIHLEPSYTQHPSTIPCHTNIMNTIKNIIGWYGVLAILVAYGLVSFQILDVDMWAYQVLNITGAVALVCDALRHKDYAPMTLNIAWILIGTISLIRMLV